MRPTGCKLLRYHKLQHRWRPATRPSCPSAFLAADTIRRKLLSSSVQHSRLEDQDPFILPQHPAEVQPSLSISQREREIIARARAYNITNRDQLRFESWVANTQTLGMRLVDKTGYCEDFYLWTILLDYQELKFGDSGVKTIWQGMKIRCGKLDLPFVGYQGDRLWSAFVSTGTRDHKFLEDIVKYEYGKGCQRPGFFVEVVCGLLKSEDPSSAKIFARKLQRSHPPNTDELFEVFIATASLKNPSLDLFTEIYALTPHLRMYGSIVPYLCSTDRFADAWIMHKYFLSRQDLPQSFEAIQPLVQDLVKHNRRLDSLLHGLANVGVSFEGQARRFYAEQKSLRYGVSSENLNIVSSNTMGVRPRNLSDEFVARALSTTAFSFGAVIGGLRMFGLKSIGPHAVRAMGLTARDLGELAERFSKLAELELDTGSSAFVRIVRKVTMQGSAPLLASILQSDQHPDVFEDLQLQKRLLVAYYRDRDWPSVNRTLAVLTMGQPDDAAQEWAANYVLQAALTLQDWHEVPTIMSRMRQHGHRYHHSTIKHMFYTVLPKREGIRIPRQNGFDDVGFLISLWQEVVQSGAGIEVTRWRELLRRLGMLGRTIELERTVSWLARWYSRRACGSVVADASAPRELDLLLSRELQSAIISWGFIHPPRPESRRDQFPWTRGLRFLRHLEEEYEGSIDIATVRLACLQRLRQLFNHRGVSRSVRNFRLVAQNRDPLRLYIRTLEQTWKGPLFPDKQALLRQIMAPSYVKPRDLARNELSRRRASYVARMRLMQRKVSDTTLDAGRNGHGSESRQDDETRGLDVVMYNPGSASWEEHHGQDK